MGLKELPRAVVRTVAELFGARGVAVIGCHALGIQHKVCELDLLVSTKEERRAGRLSLEGQTVDVLPVTQADLESPERSISDVTLANMVILMDEDWSLTAACAKVRRTDAKRSAVQKCFLSSLARLGRVQEALDEGLTLDAGFSVVSAAYDAVEALTCMNGWPLAPSHISAQLRGIRQGGGFSVPHLFEALGCNGATVAGVKRRLDAHRRVQGALEKLVAPTDRDGLMSLYAGADYLRLVESKVRFLVDAHLVVEAYCYLGFELVRMLEELYQTRCENNRLTPRYHRMLTELMSSDRGPPGVGRDTLRMLVLDADRESVVGKSVKLKGSLKAASLMGAQGKNALKGAVDRGE